jgi:opacity protein-like surface antigen
MGRMKVFTSGVAAVGVFAATIASASAADLLAAPPPPVEAIGTPVTELGSGWYLRGDGDWTQFLKPKEDRAYSLERGYQVPLTALKLQNTWSGGGGFGYKFNEWLRADVTGEYLFSSRFRDYSSRTQFAEGFNLESGKLESAVGLVNGYVDLGTWYGITPYVGGGIGVAQKRFSDFYSQTTCTTTACGGGVDGAFPIGPMAAITRTNKTTYDLAWALTGGVSFALFGGLSLDANYRYLNLGKAASGYDTEGFDTRLKDIRAHEVRVGIRYMID